MCSDGFFFFLSRTSIKSFTVKQKHGLSNGHSDSITLDNRLSSSSPAGSQSKGSASPEVDQQMELIIDISPSPDSTPDELSSMPSPLAASVLLDSQSDVVTGFKQEVSHLFPVSILSFFHCVCKSITDGERTNQQLYNTKYSTYLKPRLQ